MADFSLKAILELKDRITAPLRRVSRAIGRGLTRALTRAKFAAKSLGRDLGRIASVGKIAIGATAALAAATFGLASSYATATDNLAKFARRSGITAQTYAEMRFASDLAGVSAEQFDGAIEKMTRNLGDLRAGQGQLNSLLKKVNPAFLAQLKSVTNNEEALQLLTSAMGSLKDPSKRASLAAAAFGRAGQKMTLLLEGGEKGLAAARAEFRRLHGEIDGKALKSAEDFIDAQARLKLSISGVRTAIGSRLLPVLQPLLDRLTEWIVANRELIATKVEQAIKGIGAALAGINWRNVLRQVGRMVELMGKLWKVIDSLLGEDGPLIVFAAVIGSRLVAAFGGASKAAAGAWKIFAAHPFLAIGAGILGATGLLDDFVGLVGDAFGALTSTGNLADRITTKEQVAQLNALAVAQRNAAVVASARGDTDEQAAAQSRLRSVNAELSANERLLKALADGNDQAIKAARLQVLRTQRQRVSEVGGAGLAGDVGAATATGGAAASSFGAAAAATIVKNELKIRVDAPAGTTVTAVPSDPKSTTVKTTNVGARGMATGAPA